MSSTKGTPELKVLPIHRVVEALERVITNVPMGQPSFGDERYAAFDLNSEHFFPLPKRTSTGKIAFVDGGSAELLSAPNFAVGFIRVYFGLFRGDQRLEPTNLPSRIDFFIVCYSTIKSNHITYKTEIVPVKEEWKEFLPNVVDLEFNSFDQTLMSGNQGWQ